MYRHILVQLWAGIVRLSSLLAMTLGTNWSNIGYGFKILYPILNQFVPNGIAIVKIA